MAAQIRAPDLDLLGSDGRPEAPESRSASQV